MPKRYSKVPVINKSLRHSVHDGAYYSVMVGAGESYLTAFAVFLKATTSQIGFLASVPPLLASFAQLFSAWLGHKTGSRKAIILFGALLQGFVWIPLALLPIWFPDYAVPILIGCVILYYASGNLAALQWSSLMGELVEERRRGRYFALRTRIASLAAFVSLVICGLILDYFDKNAATQTGYLVVFAIAFIARLVSVSHLMRMYDPPGKVAALEMPSQHNWQWMKESQFLRFSLYIALVQFSVAIASPFFSLYLLRDLEFSYLQFMSCTAITVFMQFLTLSHWGRISDLVGNRLILVICGALIPLVPLLWLISSNFYYLICTQALGGFIWAGFTLSIGNFLYDMIPAEKRATLLAVHNVFASIGIFLGALLGGYLGAVLPQNFTLFEYKFELDSVLYHLFFLSFLLRLLMAVAFLPYLKEVRKKKTMPIFRLVFRISRFNPLTGLVFDIVASRRKGKNMAPKDEI